MSVFNKMSIRINLHEIATVSCIVFIACLSLLPSCTRGPKEEVVEVPDIDSLPGMATTGITSLISDSGIIRYRIITEEWLIFDKTKQPYWFFPKGINVERFDSTLHVDARIKSDTAYFYERKQLWELKGNVHLENLQGEKFDTELLFWDQKLEKIYSDKYIHIEQKERIITGIGFDSNQSMTIYTIRKPQGIFPIEGKIGVPDSSAAERDTVLLENNMPK